MNGNEFVGLLKNKYPACGNISLRVGIFPENLTDVIKGKDGTNLTIPGILNKNEYGFVTAFCSGSYSDSLGSEVLNKIEISSKDVEDKTGEGGEPSTGLNPFFGATWDIFGIRLPWWLWLVAGVVIYKEIND